MIDSTKTARVCDANKRFFKHLSTSHPACRHKKGRVLYRKVAISATMGHDFRLPPSECFKPCCSLPCVATNALSAQCSASGADSIQAVQNTQWARSANSARSAAQLRLVRASADASHYATAAWIRSQNTSEIASGGVRTRTHRRSSMTSRRRRALRPKTERTARTGTDLLSAPPPRRHHGHAGFRSAPHRPRNWLATASPATPPPRAWPRLRRTSDSRHSVAQTSAHRSA